MRTQSYDRLKDVAWAAFLLVGTVIALLLPVLWDNTTAGFITGAYFGWLGTYIWHHYQIGRWRQH